MMPNYEEQAPKGMNLKKVWLGLCSLSVRRGSNRGVCLLSGPGAASLFRALAPAKGCMGDGKPCLADSACTSACVACAWIERACAASVLRVSKHLCQLAPEILAVCYCGHLSARHATPDCAVSHDHLIHL